MTKSIESIVDSQAFKAILGTSEHLGPFYQNPKIDKMYRTLRLLGFTAKESHELIQEEINRRVYENRRNNEEV